MEPIEEIHNYEAIDQVATGQFGQARSLYNARRAANFSTYALYGSGLALSLGVATLMVMYSISLLQEPPASEPSHDREQVVAGNQQLHDQLNEIGVALQGRMENLEQSLQNVGSQLDQVPAADTLQQEHRDERTRNMEATLDSLTQSVQGITDKLDQVPAADTLQQEHRDERTRNMEATLDSLTQAMADLTAKFNQFREPNQVEEEARKRLQESESKNKDQKMIANFTIFNRRVFNQDGLQGVTVGMTYENADDPYPSLQFCYTTRPTSQGGKDEQYNLARYENGQYINVLENYDEDTDEVSHSTLLEAQKLCVFMK